MSIAIHKDTGDESLHNSMILNETVLKTHNLVFYPTNNTLSNVTVCYYIAAPTSSYSTPILSLNGTISPGLSKCSDPVHPIRTHGIIGIVVGIGFAVTLVLSIANLQNGRYTRRRRYRQNGSDSLSCGRRRPHYLCLGTAVVGLVASFNAVDVDRAVVPGSGFEAQSICYGLLHPLLLASIFEVMRCWTWWTAINFEEAEHKTWFGKRAVGVLTSLFYLLDVTALGLIIVRNWDDLKKQWYLEQTETIARPAATDGRFQAGYLMMTLCYLVVVLYLFLGWKRHHRLAKTNPIPGFSAESWQLFLATCLTSMPTGYNVASLFVWRVSPYNTQAKQAWYYGYGMIPVVLVLCVLNISTIARPKGGSSGPRGMEVNNSYSTSSVKASCWHRSSLHTLHDDTNTMNLHTFADVRGQEEKHGTITGRWWWQTKEENNGCITLEEVQPEVIPLDILPKVQKHMENLGSASVGQSITATESTFPPSSRSARIPQQRQGSPIRSMLDV